MEASSVSAQSANGTQIRASVAPIIAVPLLLALLDATSHAWRAPPSEYVMLPPFAVIAFLLFSQTNAAAANLRSIVVLPCVGAAAGAFCWQFLGAGAMSVALAIVSVLVAQIILRAYMPPALALAALAPLLRVHVGPYVAGVAIGTSIIAAAFILWRAVCRWLIVDLVGYSL